MEEKDPKNALLSFCGGREAFHQEIVLRGIQPCFLHDGAHGALKCNQGSERSIPANSHALGVSLTPAG